MNHGTQVMERGTQLVTICSWCLPEKIRVLRAPLSVGAAPVISFELDGKGFPKSAHTILRGEVHDLRVSHGICPDCSKRFCEGLVRQQ
jgi:hypothetical protein